MTQLQKPTLPKESVPTQDWALPRLRTDLDIIPIKDEMGVVYYDIHDPHTLGTLRLYDFEWQLAKLLTHPQTLQEYLPLAKQTLGFEPTQEELFSFIGHLLDFGLCEQEAAQVSSQPALLASETKTQTAPTTVLTKIEAHQEATPVQKKETQARPAFRFSAHLLAKGLLFIVLSLLGYLFVLLFQSRP